MRCHNLTFPLCALCLFATMFALSASEVLALSPTGKSSFHDRMKFGKLYAR